jgi:hypothetical protein
MVNPQEPAPIRLAGGPPADALEGVGAIAELVRAPGEQEHVLRRAQSQERGVDLGHTENDQSPRGPFDLAVQVVADFVFCDRLEARQNHGITRRLELRCGAMPRHQYQRRVVL